MSEHDQGAIAIEDDRVICQLDKRSGPAVIVWTGSTYTVWFDSYRGERATYDDIPPVQRAVTVARLRALANQLEDLSEVPE